MRAVSFRVDLTPDADGVGVAVITPDGESIELANITSPTELLGFGPMFAAYMATLVSVSVMQCREA